MKQSAIDQYISAFPTAVQDTLQRIRATIREAVPEAQETIKYRMPTFVLHENLVHFAAFKKHIGFYPTPSGIRHFKRELTPYDTSKGAVQFPHDKPIPYTLIKKITVFRAKEARNRQVRRTKDEG